MNEVVHQFFRLFIYKTDVSLDKGKVKLLTKLIFGPTLGLSALLVLIFGLLGAYTASIALASHPGGLEISILGASLVALDQNSFCDSTANPDGSNPDGIWLPVVVTNTTNGTENYTYTGLQATLTAPANIINSDPIRYLGNLAPGQSTSFFYFMDYRALRDLAGCTDSGPGITTWYNEPYTITIQSLDGSISGSGTTIFADSFNSTRLIQAQAGGTRVSDTVGPGIAVGQVFTQHVVYDFGNTVNERIFFQPTGNGSFPDECFRLVGSEIINVGANVSGIPLGTQDTLSFANVSIGNDGGSSLQDNVTIEYQYLALCDPGSAQTFTYPWAPQISGNDFKYDAAGYGPSTFPFSQPITNVVGISKSVTPQILPTGGTVTYTIEFANSYTQSVYLTQITDTLDPGIQYGGMVAGLSDILPSNSTISPTLGATGTLVWYSIPFPNNNASYLIPALSSIRLVYTATVTSTAGLYNNVAFGVIGNSVVGPANASVRVGLPPNLNVNKASTGPVPFEPGDLITYTIVISNSGGDAFDVTVSDTIPLYTNFVANSVTITPPTAGGTSGSPPIIASGITITQNSVVTITYNVIIDDPLPAGVDTITNTVAVTNTEVPTPTTDTITDSVVAAPTLNILKDDGGITAQPGDTVVYTLVFSNTGNQEATNVVLTDTVPANTTFDAANSDLGWSCATGPSAGSICTLVVGSVAAGTFDSVDFAVTIDDPLLAGVTQVFNTSVIGDDRTPNADNDSDTTPVLNPSIAVTKNVIFSPTVPFAIVTYTINITNTGQVTLDPVTLTDKLPAGLAFVKGTGNPADPIVSGNGLDLTWDNLGLLDPQQSLQISFNAQVVTETTGTYINIATAIGKHTGGTVTDSDDAPIFVTDPAVQIEKDMVPPGVVDGVITFTIKVTNVGPSPLGFVPLVDTFTGPIEYIGGTPPADDTGTPGVLRWTDLVATFGGSPLAPNEAFALTTAFRLTTVATEFSITNTAVVSEARDIYDNLANRDEDLEPLINVPTYVDLLYFEVNQQGGQFVLDWATAVEIDNFGFRILRSRTGQLADAVEIGFVSGQGHGTSSGQIYTFVDKNVTPGQTYTYWLVDVDFSGQETVHGPETLKLSGSPGSRETTIYLPLIIK